MRTWIVSCGLAAITLAVTTATAHGQAGGGNGAPDPRAILLAAEVLQLGRAAESCMLLDIAAGPDTRYVPALVLYGDCHMEQGDLASAERYFARALALEPDNPLLRSRLDEARTIQAFVTAPEPIPQPPAQAGVAEAAILQSPPDTAAVAPIPDPRLAGSVSLARGYDSNVNSGTYHSVVDAVIGGVTVPLTMTPESRARGSAFTRLTGEYGVMQPLSDDSAGQVVARIEATIHDQWSEYDKLGLSLSGRYLRLAEGWSLSLGPNLHYTLDADGAYMISAGAGLSGRQALADGLDLVGQADWRFEFYPDDAGREAALGSARLGLSYDLGHDWSLGASLIGKVTEKAAPSQSFSGIGARLSLEGPLADYVKLLASYAVSRDAYQASPAAFPQDRVDIEHNLALTLDWNIPTVDGLSVFAQYDYQVNNSTIPVYDTERHRISTGLRFTF
ncbi:tetratricopeptide repeat protein [Devosia sp. YIM 151766]|uniref:tetratricopeptide repeat protein n=1 Tax=Devosia sp. YIM 151766 TaxID=3017325 RepID=UPI00255CF05E|nr:tetratricopeptide repeat protein [Devosia sp. YIM 151766]WIY53353.1 tetratricopeptide repeat protein [Devosia sp. YIM 151766]